MGGVASLVAVRDAGGDVFGGFSAVGWTKQPTFYGSGESFLWCFPGAAQWAAAAASTEAGPRPSSLRQPLAKFGWQRSNENFQYSTDDALAFGGGGIVGGGGGGGGGGAQGPQGPQQCYGLWIDGAMRFGCTHACATCVRDGHASGAGSVCVMPRLPCLPPSLARRVYVSRGGGGGGGGGGVGGAVAACVFLLPPPPPPPPPP
eukprot:COSAG01_NODE_3906_length_5559_cov_5.852381_5_plen_202_part_01